MTKVFEAPTDEFIAKTAQALKQVEAVKAPEWATYAKTGVHKERAPKEEEWWYVRAAAMLRSVYKLGPVGVEKLRTKYGGKKNRGHKPEQFRKGSGSVARHVLQQLDKAGFTKKQEKAGHKGRVLTAEGKKFLDNIAMQCKKQ